jgi:DNA polymerase III epsilon subunit family exonuclease
MTAAGNGQGAGPAGLGRDDGLGASPGEARLGGTPWAVVDLETTGFDPWPEHRAVEVAVVRLAPAGSVVAELDTLINPGRAVEATEIHGITDGMLRHAPRFAEVAGEVAALLEGAVVVAHNVLFDVGFLRGEFQQAGLTMPPVAALCTAQLTRLLYPDSEAKLTECCRRFGIHHDEPHAALSDARATARLLTLHLETARARGLVSLAELEWLPGPPLPSGWGPWPRGGRTLRRADVPRLPALRGGALR